MQQLSKARAVKGLLREFREELAMGTAASLTPFGSAHIPGATASTPQILQRKGEPQDWSLD